MVCVGVSVIVPVAFLLFNVCVRFVIGCAVGVWFGCFFFCVVLYIYVCLCVCVCVCVSCVLCLCVLI